MFEFRGALRELTKIHTAPTLGRDCSHSTGDLSATGSDLCQWKAGTAPPERTSSGCRFGEWSSRKMDAMQQLAVGSVRKTPLSLVSCWFCYSGFLIPSVGLTP